MKDEAIIKMLEKTHKRRQEFERERKLKELDSRIITKEKVVEGLKFIAEHQDLDQSNLVNGLLDLGCGFTFDDIREQLPVTVGPFEGMKIGDSASGACVLVNFRNSELGRSYCEDRFLSVDDEESVYHFIRVVTGEETYTKKKVDAMNKAKVLRKTKKSE